MYSLRERDSAQSGTHPSGHPVVGVNVSNAAPVLSPVSLLVDVLTSLGPQPPVSRLSVRNVNAAQTAPPPSSRE